MNRLLSFLLKEALGSVAGNQIRKSIRSLKALVVYYATLAVFAAASVTFLYVLIYEWLARVLGPEGAAAILCGGNLIVVSIMLTVRKGRGSRRASAPAIDPAMSHPALSAGIALGENLRAGVLKITPPVLVAAAVVGLLIGVAPRFRRKYSGWTRGRLRDDGRDLRNHT